MELARSPLTAAFACQEQPETRAAECRNARKARGFTISELGAVDAVVVADFDRDGHSDVATPGFPKATVRRGRGDGTFLRRHSLDLGGVFEGTGGGAAVADFNRDGWRDLALSESSCHPDCRPHFALVFLNQTALRARR